MGRATRRGRKPSVAVAVAAALVVAATAGACGTGPGRFHSPAPLPGAPEPAASPPPTAPPAGRTVAVGTQPEGVAVSAATSTVAVAVRGAHPGVDLLDARTATLEKFVALGGEARHLQLGGPAGPLLVPAESDDRLYELALPSGAVEAAVPVGRQPHDAAAVGSTVMVGDELADTAHVVVAGRVTRVVPAPLQPGGVAAVDHEFVVVGVRARTVAVYRPDGTLVDRLAAGAGPTHVVAGPDGYFYVADTLGGALLVYRLAGGAVRAVGTVDLGGTSRPYGVAVDATTGWVFVTLTSTDQLVGLHLDGAAVTARAVWATGRQPNSVAVDPPARSVVVTDTGDDRLQFIPFPGAS
ncbi:MAG: YncE family protein [Acidobacteriota bacterium]|nr:YncE family protein [Acidobacteriota bacterium]